ncbi:uncharacterized protein LOC121382585 [Gigantopelta aegis]|uniref:uncharacterized protein LOC121382585 n=1 Tax=Gigantopelta aegis TaxID=1735272 RepID=UPI001B8875BF|nr:uncharacterized protein LOC121382585 [Gigantopelta aegis]
MGHTGNVKAVDGKAQFFGTPQSYLSIPFFSGNDLRPRYKLSLVLESGAASGLPVTVVSNARFRPSTFGIYIVQQGIYVVVVPRPDKQNSALRTPVVVGLPLDISGPNRVTVDHDDETKDLWLTVNDKSVHAVVRMPMVSSEPLYIGAGSSPVQPTEPLSGFVSSLSFHKCPRKTNKR